ncbi:MAG: carboxypeptidase M32 [Anaerolineae bacterium]|nr:carboxypeptidase M32 [Anaerolineae bacterium]MDW8172298.1 carboxypeptidase M32 [Anaerolineae bacterium]
MSHYQALLSRLSDVASLREAAAVLGYDQQTAMPPGGVQGRARQLALLSRLSHETFTAEETGRLLEAAAAEVGTEGDEDAPRMVRVAREDYAQATKLPTEYVAAFAQATSLGYQTWVRARQAKDFAMFAPTLKRLVELARQGADYLGYDEHPYDALLGQYERGMTTRQVAAIFEAHRPALVELISAIQAAPQVDDSPLRQHFPIEAQKRFATEVVQAMGFDFQRGAQAVAVHPFCTSFGVNDVRITTRFDENFLSPALFGMIHEAGHGMYEQGSAQELDGTLLAGGTSLGVHESQSRLWENMIGRSESFWRWAYPKLQAAFPDQLEDVSLDAFYQAINKVQPSFIRVEADEATYNLHIILRFELEQALLTGDLTVDDLPQAWNDKFSAYFGMTPPDDALGVLQDVHWSSGLMGYFPTYALGNLLAAQYLAQARRAMPSLMDDVAQGQFGGLLGWLRENIHRHGRKFTSAELTQRICGEGINPAPYVAYLQTKYCAIYGL